MGAVRVRISELIEALRDNREAYGDLDVRFPDHGSIRGTCVAQDGDDPVRPLVAFLLEDADLV